LERPAQLLHTKANARFDCSERLMETGGDFLLMSPPK